MEDLAYRRLIEQYYLRESPLPQDIQVTAKLVRLRTMADVVESVLKEFFILTDDGWSHARCDEEISNMRDKQAQTEAKNAHESERMKRHRERRAKLFTALRAFNVVPAWDTAMKELQRLHDTTCNAPETRTGALPATLPQRLSLPTPTPTPNTYSPDLLSESEQPSGFTIPLNDSTEYQILVTDFETWKATYLAVDVAQELREIRAWSLANKTRRKTKTGVLRFVVSWLAKAQDNPTHSRQFIKNAGTSGSAWEGAQ